MTPDIRKLVEQEPEFADYSAKVLLDVFMRDTNFKPLLLSVYQFYQMGNSVEEVSRWIRNMNSLMSDMED